jgi:hypothetical protein
MVVKKVDKPKPKPATVTDIEVDLDTEANLDSDEIIVTFDPTPAPWRALPLNDTIPTVASQYVGNKYER